MLRRWLCSFVNFGAIYNFNIIFVILKPKSKIIVIRVDIMLILKNLCAKSLTHCQRILKFPPHWMTSLAKRGSCRKKLIINDDSS